MDSAKIDALLEECGLSAHRDLIRAHQLPCVYLSLGEHDAGSGVTSRIGGDPDLPAAFDWPIEPDGTPMRFVMQLRLAELPPVDGIAMPSAGLLSVFIGAMESAADVPHALLILPDETSLARRPAIEPSKGDLAFPTMPPHRLNAIAGADFPRWASDDDQTIEKAIGDEDLVLAYREDFIWGLEPKGEIIAKLFGHAAGIGHDPRPDAYVAREIDRQNPAGLRWKIDIGPAVNWRNLLMIDSSSKRDFTIADAGYIQFLGHKDALARGDFADLFAQIESS